jgi:anthranilate synthase component 1
VLALPLPDSTDPLALCQRWPQRYPFLLQSVVHGTSQSRYDILFAANQERLWLTPDGQLNGLPKGSPEQSFLDALDGWIHAMGGAPDPGDLPFGGGWFVYLGYELAGEIETRLRLPRHEGDFPTAFAVRCPAAIIIDHAAGQVMAVAEPGRQDCLEKLRSDWMACEHSQVDSFHGTSRASEEDPDHFRRSLATIHDYILDGDVFQVNVSRRWQVDAEVSPTAVYQALRASNPAPFAALARWRDSAVVSSSPERLVQTGGGWAQTRPIAGTRPREAGSSRDDDLRREELIQHPKERAEHIMLIDLERNDLGRVCQPGSVEVDELMVVESYAHVHHIVSNVRGRLRPDATPGQIIRAVFPGGTITGCPKVRCMEIIAELEQDGRGPYTGSLGYINLDGSMDLNILIRTLLVEPGRVRFRAGAGIVADSEVERELEETRSKAKGLLMAINPDIGGEVH